MRPLQAQMTMHPSSLKPSRMRSRVRAAAGSHQKMLRRALAVSASNWRTSKAPGARMLLPSAMHEMMPVHRESRSRRDQAQLTHDHDLSQPCSRSSCNISCFRPGWPAERGGAAVIFTVHEAGPAARARCASGRSEAARWRAGGPDGGGRAVSSPVEAPRPWTTTSFVSVQNKSLEYK